MVTVQRSAGGNVMTWLVAALAGGLVSGSLCACGKLGNKGGTRGDGEDSPPPSNAISSVAPVPPAAPFNATPVAVFADAGEISSKPAIEQARFYASNGQLWMGRLVLEQQALSATGTTAETELLATICAEQGDRTCVDACSRKLGRKIAFDGGLAASPDSGVAAGTRSEHREPDTDVARVRDLVLKEQYAPARVVLEPKVLDGSASKEEIRLLKTICTKQSDRMCVALCNAKLR